VVVLFVEIVTKKCMIMIAYKEVYDWLFMLRFLSMYKVCCRIVATHKKNMVIFGSTSTHPIRLHSDSDYSLHE
jgi:hypothetical protein